MTHDAAATCADLLRFIDESPTPFHAAHNAAARLRAAGFAAAGVADPTPYQPPST